MTANQFMEEMEKAAAFAMLGRGMMRGLGMAAKPLGLVARRAGKGIIGLGRGVQSAGAQMARRLPGFVARHPNMTAAGIGGLVTTPLIAANALTKDESGRGVMERAQDRVQGAMREGFAAGNKLIRDGAKAGWNGITNGANTAWNGVKEYLNQ